MLKIADEAKVSSPIKQGGGVKLGGLIGAITGIILSCWLSVIFEINGAPTVLAVGAGLILGLIIGIAVGSKIDFRLTPKAKQDSIQDDMTVPKKHSKGRMH
jgi:hypothetical protein